MSHEGLPIFKAAYDLALLADQEARRFGAPHRQRLGQELRGLSRALLRRIVRANHACDKIPDLDQLRLQLAQLRLTADLCRDVGAFATRAAHGRVLELVVDVSKQSEGWRKDAVSRARK